MSEKNTDEEKKIEMEIEESTNSKVEEEKVEVEKVEEKSTEENINQSVEEEKTEGTANIEEENNKETKNAKEEDKNANEEDKNVNNEEDKNLNNEETKNVNEENKKEDSINAENKKPTKKRISILGILGKTIMWAIIVLCIVLLVRAFAYHKYDVFGYRAYLIRSGSMEPTIHVQDAVIIKELDKYQKDDIVAYIYDSHNIFVHRIIEEYTEDGKTMYLTKGDFNNAADDKLVAPSQIQGKVVGRIPNIGKAITYIQSNFIILIAIIIALAAIIIVWRLIRNGKKARKQE